VDVETSSARGTYEVCTDVFEGPFDLLLHLILSEAVELYDISLSRIVDAYLAEIERMESLDLEVATGFLLIAATLVELKSRRLLPDESDIDLDDELALWEERDLLLARLLEAKTFKDAASVLERMADAAARSWPRTAGLEDDLIHLAPDPLAGVGPLDIRAAYIRALTPKPVPKVNTDHLAPVRTTVAEAMVEVAEEIAVAGRLSFRDLTGALVDRIEVVIRFLAVLELYKQGQVDLDQVTNFGDISISWIADHDPEALHPDLVDAYEG